MRAALEPVGLPDIPWDFQMRIWGYAYSGDSPNDVAILAEHGRPYCEGWWDCSVADLAGDLVAYRNEDYRRVKDRAALPWVAEHMIRGHEEYVPL